MSYTYNNRPSNQQAYMTSSDGAGHYHNHVNMPDAHGQVDHRSSQARPRDDGGKPNKKHDMRFWKKRSREGPSSIPATTHPIDFEPVSDRPPPLPPKHNVNMSAAPPYNHPTQSPSDEQGVPQTSPPVLGQFGRHLWSWIPQVKQSSADATVRDQVKGLFVRAEQFVNNFYSRRRYHNEVSHEVLDRINCSTSTSTSELQGYLRATDLHNPIITHVLINLLLSLIAFDSMQSRKSLLPTEFQNYTILAKARTRSAPLGDQEHEEQPALSSYRVLSAFLRSDIKYDHNYLRERDLVIEDVVSSFDEAFEYWATRTRSRDDRQNMLRKVVETAADLGIFLFSEPAVYMFNWEKDHPGISDDCFAVSPRLLRVYDNDGRWNEIADHMIPLELGLVIDRSIRHPQKTMPMSIDANAVDPQPPSDPVMARDDIEATSASDAEISSSLSSSDESEEGNTDPNPFNAKADHLPEKRQPRNQEQTRHHNGFNVPTPLRPGSHDTQVHMKVTNPTDHSQSYRGNMQELSLASHESLERSQRPEMARRDNVDRHGQAPPRNPHQPLETQSWPEDDRSRNKVRPPQGNAHHNNGPNSPRQLQPAAMLDNSSTSQDPRNQPTSRPRETENTRASSRPRSVASIPPLRARTTDFTESPTGWIPPHPDARRFNRSEQSPERGDRRQVRSRSSSKEPPRVHHPRPREPKSPYPPSSSVKHFNNSNPDRLAGGDERQGEGRQTDFTADGERERDRGRGQRDRSSQRRYRSLSGSAHRQYSRDGRYRE